MIVLKLKTPFDPGMYDQGNTYPHVLVTTFNMASVAQVIEIVWEYGTMDPQNGWQTGKAGIPQRTILQNDDFFSAITAAPTEGSSDSILMAAARECYNILATSDAAPGDVVDIQLEPKQGPATTGSTSDASDSSAAPAARKATASKSKS